MINYILITTIIVGFGLVFGVLISIEDKIENRLDKIITILKDKDYNEIITILKDIEHKG